MKASDKTYLRVDWQRGLHSCRKKVAELGLESLLATLRAHMSLLHLRCNLDQQAAKLFNSNLMELSHITSIVLFEFPT